MQKSQLLGILLISILIILGCNRPKDIFNTSDIDYIKSKVWNLDLSDFKNRNQLSDQKYSLYMAKLKDCPVFFINGEIYIGNIDSPQDSCFFLSDTLIITRSYFESRVDSLYKVIDTVFIGKIVKTNKDSLEILRIKDHRFDYLLGKTNDYKTLRFYNDALLTCQETQFKTISTSSGLCYGKCPMQAIEIDSLGNLFFYGSTFAFKKGYYTGKLNAESLDSIKHLLTSALINRNAFKLYDTPIDAPGTELKIILDNNDTIIVDGESSIFNYRLWQIFSKLNNSIKTGGMVKNAIPHKFLSTKYIEEK